MLIIQEPSDSGYKIALDTLRLLIRTSTSSMTAVPKPLKFLRPFYTDLKGLYDTWPESSIKVVYSY